MSPFRLNLLYIILKIPAILIAFTVQGYAKALVADKLGDKTPILVHIKEDIRML